MQLGGQRPGAATEVANPDAGLLAHEREQVPEGLLALGLEAKVLLGVPGFGHRRLIVRPRTGDEPPSLTLLRGGDGERAGRDHAGGRVAAEFGIGEERLVVAVAERRHGDEEGLAGSEAELRRRYERVRPFHAHAPSMEVLIGGARRDNELLDLVA